MNATFIKKVKAYKAIKGNEEFFILLMERADEDVYSSDGKRLWSWDILFTGTYAEVFEKACSYASNFELGTIAWKPARKGPEAVIKTIRRALLNSVEKPEFKEGSMTVGFYDKGLGEAIYHKISKLIDIPKEDFAPIKTRNVSLFLELKILLEQAKENKENFSNEKELFQYIVKNYRDGKFFSEPIKALVA